MAEMKHVGRYIQNQRKVAVAYRTVPQDSGYCLVVDTASLSDENHDSLMKLVESSAGQSCYELAEAMGRTTLGDGRTMLAAFHAEGKLQRVPTVDIEMTPTSTQVIKLNELNKIIADQKGVSIDEIHLGAPAGGSPIAEEVATAQEVKPKTAPAVQAEAQTATNTPDALSDEDLAKNLRSQADAMFKEAQNLRKQAEELVPTKKTAKAKASA
tara:strand:+ start:1562 stop:2197 length:636 start_codon:yes stop_codon:yes gene_type:complete